MFDGLGAEPAAVKAAFGTVFYLPELTNPRLVHRVFERLRLAAAANVGASHPELRDPDRLDDLVAWCAIAERWPQVRQMLQASSDEMWATNLAAICKFYGIWDRDDVPAEEKAQELEEAMSITSRLPGKLRQPDLGDFIGARILPLQGLPMTLRSIDNRLVSFGL